MTTAPSAASERATRVERARAEEPLDLADVRRRLRAIFVGSIGNLVEWYDFYAYAAFALYFAAAFFPGTRRGLAAPPRHTTACHSPPRRSWPTTVPASLMSHA